MRPLNELSPRWLSLPRTVARRDARKTNNSLTGRRGLRAGMLGFIVLAGLSGSCAGPTVDDRGVTRREGVKIGDAERRPDFILTSTTGETFDFRQETDGYLTLLYFGYTNCPDVCPIHFANLAGGLDQVPDAVKAQVRVVFVGVDPPRDTAARMREWLDHFDRSFIALLGTEVELEAAQLAAGVPPATREGDLGDGRYSVAHAGWVLGYTAHDEQTWQFPLGVRQQSWAQIIEQLVKYGDRS